MARREDVQTSIWSDPEFLDLTTEAKALYLWSFTNPRCGMAGIYKVAPRIVQLETGLDEEAYHRTVAELEQALFVRVDGPMWWVRSRVKHMRSKTDQIAKSVVSDLRSIGIETRLAQAFLAEYERVDWPTLQELLEVLPRVSQEPQQGSGEPQRGSDEAQVSFHGNGNGNGTGPGKGPGEVDVAVQDDARVLPNELPPDDTWPNRLPDELTETAGHVLARLGELADSKPGSHRPTRRRVGEVVADFPNHDHRAVVGDVVDFWRDGRGANTARKDLVRVYRDRCQRVLPAGQAPVRPGSQQRPNRPRHGGFTAQEMRNLSPATLADIDRRVKARQEAAQ